MSSPKLSVSSFAEKTPSIARLCKNGCARLPHLGQHGSRVDMASVQRVVRLRGNSHPPCRWSSTGLLRTTVFRRSRIDFVSQQLPWATLDLKWFMAWACSVTRTKDLQNKDCHHPHEVPSFPCCNFPSALPGKLEISYAPIVMTCADTGCPPWLEIPLSQTAWKRPVAIVSCAFSLAICSS